MGSKRRLRRKACTGKRQYLTHAEANVAAHNTARTFQQRIGAYKCTYCGNYHVGHTPRAIKQFIGH